MNDYDPRVAAGLHALVDDEPTSAPPTMLVLNRGRRARRRRTLTGVAASGGVLVLVIAGGAAINATDTASRTPTPPAATGAVADPAVVQLRLVAALDTTGGTTFTQTVAVAVEHRDKLSVEDRNATAHLHGLRLSGPFDPKARTGHLRAEQPDGISIEQRLVNGELFVGDGRGWKKVPGQHTGFSIAGLVTDRIVLSSDPTRFLDTLREFGKVESVGATGDTDTFRFKAQVRVPKGAPGQDATRGDTYEISGEVSVRRMNNRIVKMSYRLPAWHTDRGKAVVALVTIELSGHGSPVSVERPTNAVD